MRTSAITLALLRAPDGRSTRTPRCRGLSECRHVAAVTYETITFRSGSRLGCRSGIEIREFREAPATGPKVYQLAIADPLLSPRIERYTPTLIAQAGHLLHGEEAKTGWFIAADQTPGGGEARHEGADSLTKYHRRAADRANRWLVSSKCGGYLQTLDVCLSLSALLQ